MKASFPSDFIRIDELNAIAKSGNGMLDFLSLIVVAIDAEGKVTLINKKGHEILGLELGEAIGKDWVERFVPLKNRDVITKAFKEAMAGKESLPSNYETMITTKDGERLISWNTTCMRCEDGKIAGWFKIGMDVTDSKILESRLKESQYWFEELYTESRVAIELYDSDGRLLDVNKSCLDMFGIQDAKEVRGLSLFANPHVPNMVKEKIRKGETVKYESRFSFNRVKELGLYKTSKSGIMFIDVIITALSSQEGWGLRGYLVQIQDITQRKMAETQISFQASLLDQVRNAVIAMDVDGKIVYWNKFSETLYLWRADEALGKKLFDLLLPETPPEVIQKIYKKIETEDYWESEFVVSRKDRKEIKVNTANVAIRSADRKLIGFVGVSSDISERKKMEEALRVSERRYRGMLEDQTELIARFSPDGKVTYMNRAYRRYFGEKERGFSDYHSHILEEDLDIAEDALKSLTIIRPVSTVEYRVTIHDGCTRWTQWINRAMFNDEKQLVEYQAVGRDITEQKDMERAVQESEARYRGIVEDQTEFICKWLPDGKITYVNGAYAKFFGSEALDLVDRDVMEVIPKEDRGRFQEAIASLTEEKCTSSIENRVMTSRGIHWTKWTIRAIFDDEGTLTAYQSVGTDLTDRKIIEEALNDSERQMADIINFLPDPTIVINSDGKVLAWNHAAEELTGVKAEKMLGKGNADYSVLFYGIVRPMLIDLVLGKNPEVEKIYPKLERKGDSIKAEGYVKLPDGRSLYTIGHASPLYDSSGKTIGAIETFEDITDRKAMEEELKQYSGHLEKIVEDKTKQLRDAERLAAIGETATMVGHDLRNPLQAIVYTIFLAREITKDIKEASDRAEMEKILFRIEKNIDYMNKIVSDVQDFARPFSPELIEVELQPLLEEILSTIRFPENVKVVIDVAVGFKVTVDTLLIRRVFTNIITNALQAMPSGGQLTIKGREEGEMRVVTISDTGVGISKDNMKRLFQPLFTTKSKGQGMGLAVAKRIIEAHSGTILAESGPGAGTTFIINVPKQQERQI